MNEPRIKRYVVHVTATCWATISVYGISAEDARHRALMAFRGEPESFATCEIDATVLAVCDKPVTITREPRCRCRLQETPPGLRRFFESLRAMRRRWFGSPRPIKTVN